MISSWVLASDLFNITIACRRSSRSRSVMTVACHSDFPVVPHSPPPLLSPILPLRAHISKKTSKNPVKGGCAAAEQGGGGLVGLVTGTLVGGVVAVFGGISAFNGRPTRGVWGGAGSGRGRVRRNRVNALVDGANARVDCYILQVDCASTRVDAVSTRVDCASTRVDAASTRVDGVNSQVDGDNSRVDADNSRVDGVNLRVDGVNLRVVGENTRVDRDNTQVDDANRQVDGANAPQCGWIA